MLLYILPEQQTRSKTPLARWFSKITSVVAVVDSKVAPSHQGTQEDTIEAMYLADTRSRGNKGNSCSPLCAHVSECLQDTSPLSCPPGYPGGRARPCYPLPQRRW